MVIVQELWLEVWTSSGDSCSELHILLWDVLQIRLSLPSSEKSNHAPEKSEEEDKNEERR